MLILRRRVNQSIILEVTDSQGKVTRIRVQVTDTTSKSIGIGIDAPDNVLALRDELVHHEYPGSGR